MQHKTFLGKSTSTSLNRSCPAVGGSETPVSGLQLTFRATVQSSKGLPEHPCPVVMAVRKQGTSEAQNLSYLEYQAATPTRTGR